MHTIIQSNTDLPPELCVKPLPLVGFSGLDNINNAVHKLIWETFSTNRRTDVSPVQFKLIGNAHEFPVIKPKRSSYDWYIPKGILKRNWMNKHLNEIPAVIVVFYDLDWNDPHWNERMIECSSRVRSLRAALEGRNSIICVVLIQSALPMPAGEDVLANERHLALCSSCELNASLLYVLPHGDHLQGYIIRLETAFSELAQGYYHNEIKVVKSHKEHLNKNAHIYLIVRHHFKIGFLSELKQDIQSAYKYYMYAYNTLLEIRIVDTNALEIRTVAGFINYKLCRLMFSLSLPRDAINQFKAHIDRFKMRMGFQELAFEHYAWLSKQYSVFGDIFDEAVKMGLPAVQTQHPGIYYQMAAQFAIKRKQACQELCASVLAYPNPDPLEGYAHMEFYGQRPWRPGKISSEPPDPQVESNGIQALQFLEKQTNHSNIIIALYGLAISQFKTYRCPRTRRELVLEMADEYYQSKDFGKALTLFSHMLCDFRVEKWWSILSEILKKAIKCAYLTANVQDYVLLALEILGSSIKINMDDKKRVHENLLRLFKKQIPFGDKDLPHDILQNAIIIWQPVFSSNLNFSLDMTNIRTCIETKATLTNSTIEIDQNAVVEIYIKSTCPFLLIINRVSVVVHSNSASQEFVVNSESGILNFKCNEVKKFVVEFQPNSNDINTQIQIAGVNLTLGNEHFSAELKFTSQLASNLDICPEFQHFKTCTSKLDFDNIKCLNAALIVPRKSKLAVKFEHNQPALLGEWYRIGIDIDNEEEHLITDLRVQVNLLDEDTSNVEFSLKPNGTSQKLPLLLSCPEQLNTKEKIHCKFFLRAHKVETKSVNISITYTLTSDKPVCSMKNENIILSILQPFEVATKFFSMQMDDIYTFYVDEEFALMPLIESMSPWPIYIEDTAFEFLSDVKSTEIVVFSQLKDKVLRHQEIGSELLLASCGRVSEHPISLGQYVITWKRENETSSTVTKIPVLGLKCDWLPLDITLDIPAHAVVRTPIIVTYRLKNKSQQLLQLDVNMESSEGFMFAGYKQFGVSILPQSERVLEYNLYPLIAGSTLLPKLSLTCSEDAAGIFITNDQIQTLIERAVPKRLYVMPQFKGAPSMDKLSQKAVLAVQ